MRPPASENEIMDQPRVLRMHAIDLQQLRFAVAAADYGSIRQAAESLSIRHSILSRSIRQLEHLIGVTVFERSGGGVKPTPAGRRVLWMARLILEQVDVLVATANSNGRGEAGRLSIGFCTSISAGNLRATLTEFKNRHPRIELATVERSQTRLATALRNGTADVLIVTGDGPLPDNNVRPLWSERILVSLPEDHVLAAGTVVYWTDLRNETVLLSQHDPGRELEDSLDIKACFSLGSTEDRTPRRQPRYHQESHQHEARDQLGPGIRYWRELRWLGLSRTARWDGADTR